MECTTCTEVLVLVTFSHYSGVWAIGTDVQLHSELMYARALKKCAFTHDAPTALFSR